MKPKSDNSPVRGRSAPASLFSTHGGVCGFFLHFFNAEDGCKPGPRSRAGEPVVNLEEVVHQATP